MTLIIAPWSLGLACAGRIVSRAWSLQTVVTLQCIIASLGGCVSDNEKCLVSHCALSSHTINSNRLIVARHDIIDAVIQIPKHCIYTGSIIVSLDVEESYMS